MSTTKKLVISIIALSLVLCSLVGVTLAWIVDSTAPVVNTFTYGDINITLTETTGNTYKMVPGDTIKKDPKVTVLKDSEACWLFVEVTKSANFDTYMTFEMDGNWEKLNENGLTAVYYYKRTELDQKLTADKTYSVLLNDQVAVKNSVTKAMMNAIDGIVADDAAEGAAESELALRPTLTFKAYAVQKDNVASAAEAWEIALAKDVPTT